MIKALISLLVWANQYGRANSYRRSSSLARSLANESDPRRVPVGPRIYGEI